MIGESGHLLPKDGHESFQMLRTMGMLEPAFSQQIACLAGLRNRIVHEYDGEMGGAVRLTSRPEGR